MPIPDASAGGYTRLRERVVSALDLNRETPSVEFKLGSPWPAVRNDVAKTCQGMANLRDGGLIIIGRPEDPSLPDGINQTDLTTYDLDLMQDFVDKYASSITFTVASVVYQSRIYVAVQVEQFDELPVVCKNALDPDLKKGTLYIRSASGRPRTTQVQTAEDMRDLLEMAAEKMARRIVTRGMNAGMTLPAERSSSDDSRYAAELGDLNNA